MGEAATCAVLGAVDPPALVQMGEHAYPSCVPLSGRRVQAGLDVVDSQVSGLAAVLGSVTLKQPEAAHLL